jgi:hypothetical protein
MDPEDKGLMRACGNVAWEWKKRQLIELFWFHQKVHSRRHALGQQIERDRADDEDVNLTWLGARARGCVKPGVVKRLCYWREIAGVRGWDYDAGFNLELPCKFRPVVTVVRARFRRQEAAHRRKRPDPGRSCICPGIGAMGGAR